MGNDRSFQPPADRVHRVRADERSGKGARTGGARGSTGHATAWAGLTRRRFCAASGVAPAAVTAPRTGAARVDAFLGLSAELTGFPVAALNREFAGNLLEALSSSSAGRTAAIDALVRGENPADRASLEADIASAWYSGLVPGEQGPVVATVRHALVWRALGFASPPGACAPGAAWGERPPGNGR